MKQQSIGIVLCALLLTTFGHELLQRHQVARSARIARSPKVAQPHAKSHFLERAQTTSSPSESACVTACFSPTVNSITNLTISINVSTKIVGIYNKTANIGIIIDINANLTGIFNVSSGEAIIINLETQDGKVIKWQISTSFEIFVASCVSLTAYYNQSGTIINGNNLPAKYSLMINVIITSVIGGNVTANGNAFILFVQIIVRFTATFAVAGQVLQSGSFKLSITLLALVELLEGFVAGISQISGGVSIFVQKNITLSLTVLILFNSSVQIAVYTLLVLSIKGVEVATITSVTAALYFLAAFGGNSTVGVNGVFYVLATIVGFIIGKVSIQVVLQVIIKFLVDNNGNSNLAGQFTLAIDAAIETLQSNTNLSSVLKLILNVLISIKAGNLVVGGVNLSGIIKLLLSGDIVLKVIIAILVLLEVKIAIELAIINLFVYLFVLLVRGSFDVVSFVIGVVIRNVGQLVLQFIAALIATGGNLWKAILSVEVLVQIVVQFDACFKVLGLQITAKGIFSASGILQLVKQLLQQFGINIDGGISLRKGGKDRLYGGPRIGWPFPPPHETDNDYGGNASGNSSQTVNIGSISGTNTQTNNSGGTSDVQSIGAVNVWPQNGNIGGDVSHEDGNNSTGKGDQGNSAGYNFNNHQGGYASGPASQNISVGSIMGTNTDTENSGGNNTVESIGNVNLWPINGNHGGDVSHHDNNNNNSTRHHKKESEKHGTQQNEKKAGLHEKRQQA